MNPLANNRPGFPAKSDPFTQSAWRIGWEHGHGLRDAPRGIRAGFEWAYKMGLEVAAQDKAAKAIALMRSMTDDERLSVMRHFCIHCGSADPGCVCWNDE